MAQLWSKLYEKNSALPYALFSNNLVHSNVLTDQGSEGNFLPRKVLDEIYKVQPSLTVHDSITPSVFKDVSGILSLVCDQHVTLDVSLKIKHG